jgi:hypothetical protein
MISNPQGVHQPGRRIVLLSRLKRTTMHLGAMTQAFFRKGDELEAAGFETLPHDDPTLVPPKLGFRGFDRVPRNRAPLLIALLLLTGVTAAVASSLGWRSAREVRSEASRFEASARTKAANEWVRLQTFVGSRPARADR